MTNQDYLTSILSLFDKAKQKSVLAIASHSNNTLDTLILSYIFYTYNFFPYCVANTVQADVISNCVEVPKDVSNIKVKSVDITVAPECCHFMDRVFSFICNKTLSIKSKDKQDMYCQYMTYLFLTDKSLLAYELFQNCLDSRDYNYAISTLQSNLLTAYRIPSDPNLLKYGRFLTNPFTTSLGKCYGRDKELSDLVDILSRKKKNNVILVGQPGVGKTAMAEGLAQLLMSDKCPKQFEGYHLYEASLATMLAGAKYRGDFEERFESILKTVTELDTHIILFIDEIHNIMVNHGESGGSSTGMSAGDILKPYMSRPGLLLIGATTEQEYRIIAKDSALNRRFSPLYIKEPSFDAVHNLLINSKDDYQNHFNIHIEDNLLPEIIRYAETYIPNRCMPDKALDLLDESCVHCLNHTDSSELSLSDIVCATEILTGIQIPTSGEQSSNKIEKIVSHLKNSIVGQEEAIDSISSIIKRYFLGFSSKQKPIGSLLFVGPTGVGKTQLCKELAYSMFTKESFIRFDMSEYMESISVAKLIGSPPGYVGHGKGGILTNAVKNNPYSVVLFDEIEKAHPDVFNILLQVLDDGCLTDSEGVTVNFNSCIIILTSNVGAQEVSEKSSKTIGFGSTGLSNSDKKHMYSECAKKKFKPEFINRLDGVVYFNSLNIDDIKELVNRELNSLCDKFKGNNIDLDITSQVKTTLFNKCYSAEYGARFVQRVVKSDLEDLVLNYMVDNNILSIHDTVKISVKQQNGNFVCNTNKVKI